MNKIKEIFEVFIMITLGVIVFIISIPFIIISFPFTYYNRKQFEKKYSQFLLDNENANFFCYNNRKNAKEYIETEIIPKLNNNIEIVFLNGKKIENENFPYEFLSNALYKLNNYSKFPHLMKIRNGKLIDESINSIFYSIKNQNKPQEKLLKQIDNFFELK